MSACGVGVGVVGGEELEGRRAEGAERAERAEGRGMHWGPLKSAEKPHP